MLDRDPRRLAAWAAAALVLILLGAWYMARARPAASASEPPVATISVQSSSAKSAAVIVDVAGAVARPGVYRLTSADRVEDALKRAGGATRRADLSQINPAAKLEDGRQILVPTRAAAVTAAAAPTVPGGAARSQPLNLNSATLEQLDTLEGVGPATAQK